MESSSNWGNIFDHFFEGKKKCHACWVYNEEWQTFCKACGVDLSTEGWLSDGDFDDNESHDSHDSFHRSVDMGSSPEGIRHRTDRIVEEGEEEEDEDEEGKESLRVDDILESALPTEGWGDIFTHFFEGKRKCDSCLVYNEVWRTSCEACQTALPFAGFP